MSNVSHSNAEKVTGAARGIADAVRDKGREARETVEHLGSAARDMARSGMETARDTAYDYLDKGKQKAMALEESFEIQIRTRPLSAVLFAAGVGFLIALFWKRR